MPPALPADIVTMNHAHPSHYTLQPDPHIGTVLHGWQEGPKPPAYDFVLRDLRVTNLATNIRNWGGGTELNGNSIFIFETAGLCIAHLGHLHHLLEPADLDALGHIDIVMIAVDGGYTIGQADARTVVEQMPSAHRAADALFHGRQPRAVPRPDARVLRYRCPA